MKFFNILYYDFILKDRSDKGKLKTNLVQVQ